ncbi:MAG: S-layer homology domain-containing protein [Clostridiaceae bacterium]|nr:S-layer homology domain-containing protein [Clostridiaceae bacterium]
MKKVTSRLAAILLVTLMLLSITAIPIFAAGEQAFKDVPESAWFHGYVMMLYEKGIVKGYGATGKFKPEDKLTREHAAKMITLAAGLPYQGKKADFSDVKKNGEMSPYIAALVAKDNAIRGFPDGTFRPKENIRRGHAAKMAALAFGLKEGDMTQALTDLPDDVDVQTAIKILESNGVVKGYGGSKRFMPDEEINRAEFAKILCFASIVQAIEKAEDDPVPENIAAVEAQLDKLPVGQDGLTLEYLAGRLEELEKEAKPIWEAKVTGAAEVGQKLTAEVNLADATVIYQWQRSDTLNGNYTNIAGATQKSYQLALEDAGQYLRIKVMGTGEFEGTQVTSPRGPVQKARSIYTFEFKDHKRDFIASKNLPIDLGMPKEGSGPTEVELTGNPPIGLTLKAEQNNGLGYDWAWIGISLESSPPEGELQIWSRWSAESIWINMLKAWSGFELSPDLNTSSEYVVFANKPGKYILSFKLYKDNGHENPDLSMLITENTVTLNFK